MKWAKPGPKAHAATKCAVVYMSNWFTVIHVFIFFDSELFCLFVAVMCVLYDLGEEGGGRAGRMEGSRRGGGGMRGGRWRGGDVRVERRGERGREETR